MTRIRSGSWKKGYRQGYREGWKRGRHLGQCRRIEQRYPPEKGLYLDWKVLFVRAGGAPYLSLEEGVIDGLAAHVREVLAVPPDADVAGMVRQEAPDLVLVLDAAGVSFPLEKLAPLGETGVLAAVWFVDDPYHSDRTIPLGPYYDHVFTIETECVPVYEEAGCARVHYLPPAVHPGLYRPESAPTSRHREIVLIGSAFESRVRLIDALAPYLRSRDVFINGYWWERLQHYGLLSDRISGNWLSPEETCIWYNGAHIVINHHRTHEEPLHNHNSRGIAARSANPRLFEINGCGTLQLVDAREEIHRWYTPGIELDTYASPEELMEKIEYYLANEGHRRQIALNGLARTLKDHTYRHRMEQLLSALQT